MILQLSLIKKNPKKTCNCAGGVWVETPTFAVFDLQLCRSSVDLELRLAGGKKCSNMWDPKKCMVIWSLEQPPAPPKILPVTTKECGQALKCAQISLPPSQWKKGFVKILEFIGGGLGGECVKHVKVESVHILSSEPVVPKIQIINFLLMFKSQGLSPNVEENGEKNDSKWAKIWKKHRAKLMRIGRGSCICQPAACSASWSKIAHGSGSVASERWYYSVLSDGELSIWTRDFGSINMQLNRQSSCTVASQKRQKWVFRPTLLLHSCKFFLVFYRYRFYDSPIISN